MRKPIVTMTNEDDDSKGMFINFSKPLKILPLLVFINACSVGDQFEDIKVFMAEVESKPRGTITPLPEFKAYQPFTYGASNQRSPFEPPILLPTKNSQDESDITIRPPRNHVKQYLEGFPLAALAMVGSFQKGNLMYGLIEDSKGSVHRVEVGDYMGDQWGKIKNIKENRIDITEIVSDGAGGWLRRPRTIEIRGLQ